MLVDEVLEVGRVLLREVQKGRGTMLAGGCSSGYGHKVFVRTPALSPEW